MQRKGIFSRRCRAEVRNEYKGLLRKLLSGPTKKKYIDLDLPLIFCLIFCTEMKVLNSSDGGLSSITGYDTRGLLIHPVSL